MDNRERALREQGVEIDLMRVTDARVWAKEFVRIAKTVHPRVPLSENDIDWMQSWFASAITVGEMSARRAAGEARAAIEGEQEPCFTCEGEQGQPATRTVNICEVCFGESAAGAPATSGREPFHETMGYESDYMRGRREMREELDEMAAEDAAAPRPELAPALPTGNNARYDGLAGNAKWIKESATLSQVEDILRQRADLFAELKKEREAPPDLAARDELVKEFEAFAPWIIQHADICPGEELCECGKRERVQKWREALQKLRNTSQTSLAGALERRDKLMLETLETIANAEWMVDSCAQELAKQALAQLKVQR
jgi:hypothetical protein